MNGLSFVSNDNFIVVSKVMAYPVATLNARNDQWLLYDVKGCGHWL